jgi:GNAT superfamily N-acetyltransferase
MTQRPTGAEPDALVVRRAGDDDLPGVLELARRSLGWVGGSDDSEFFHWKHLESPFGPSPMWVALDGDRIVGFRTFLRWQFCRRDGSSVAAVRAVDTATDPDYQGRGIFTRLTLGALEELRAEGVQMIFNTPNAKSLPGYLKMGWVQVGRLPTAVMITHFGSVFALATARRAASLSSIAIRVGERASDVFADGDGVARLLAVRGSPEGLSTERSQQFFAWRYGYEPLRYRVMLQGSSPADGLVVFRLRRRGSAVEAVVCDVLVPESDPAVAAVLLREVARRTEATHLIRIHRSLVLRGPFVRMPRLGPTLTCRLLDGSVAPRLRDWDLTLGDVELF